MRNKKPDIPVFPATRVVRRSGTALLERSLGRVIVSVSIWMVLSAALACASYPAPEQSGGVATANAASSDYSAFTRLEFFRHVCTSTGMPHSSTAEYRLGDGSVARLSLDQDLQAGLMKFMEKRKIPYAVFVAVEPKTGRVLANVSYSSVSPEWAANAAFNVYPMASLFKIVTAAAAFEYGGVTANTLLHFRGGSCSESPGAWGKRGRTRDASMPLCEAMAHSVNPAFGRLARDLLDKPHLVATAQQFGLGTNLFGSDFIATGRITSPSTGFELMKMAAGLDHGVRISPFQVAMLFAAIGNNGVMPVPSFVDDVDDPAGKFLYNFKEAPLITITSPAVAGELIRAMSRTVNSGTARKAFADQAGQRFRTDMLVAGKTGSINGDNPVGHYNWFAGVAPAANPRIAFVALVVNNDRLRLSASRLGRAALDIYFSDNKNMIMAQLPKEQRQ